ncbi:hypothetical protein [Nocardia aurea]|uniref:hypothetical protein n=1 Tax=Nocardia aurea TaxID=2144174 RepID=UPI0033BE16C8
MSACRHESSLWGRCTACGLTWDQQTSEWMARNGAVDADTAETVDEYDDAVTPRKGNAYRLPIIPHLDGLPFLGATAYVLEPAMWHADGWTSHVIVARGGGRTSVFPCLEDGQVDPRWESIGEEWIGSKSDPKVLLALGYTAVSYLPLEVPNG